MPIKRGFRGVWSKGVVLCLVFSVTLLATAPLMAQDKSLEKQLEEAKAAIEDQQWVIRQLDKNFLKIVAELKEELDFLRALTGKQLEEIDSYLKEMQSIKLAGEAQAQELAKLEAMEEEKTRRLGQLEAVRRAQQAEKLAELELAIEEKAAKVTELEAMRQEQAKKLAQLEAIKAAQAERIERINTLFGKATDEMQAEIDSLNTKNAELVVAKDDLQIRLNVIEMKYSKLTEEYEGQRLVAEMLREGYSKALVELGEKDREIAFFEGEIAKLDKTIAFLEADAAKLEGANASLRRHRLLLGIGFIIAAYYSCQH